MKFNALCLNPKRLFSSIHPPALFQLECCDGLCSFSKAAKMCMLLSSLSVLGLAPFFFKGKPSKPKPGKGSSKRKKVKSVWKIRGKKKEKKNCLDAPPDQSPCGKRTRKLIDRHAHERSETPHSLQSNSAPLSTKYGEGVRMAPHR